MKHLALRISASDEEEEEETRKGPWTVEEDMQLIRYINLHGQRRWNRLAKAAGLSRSGKSCRLRWVNYLRPDLKHGHITADEECLILDLHSRWGNRWSQIAQRLPGRTDNEIKNYWRTHMKKKAEAGHRRCISLNNDINRGLSEPDLMSSTSTVRIPSDPENAILPPSAFQGTQDAHVHRHSNSLPEIQRIEVLKEDEEFGLQRDFCDTCGDPELYDDARPSALHDDSFLNTLSYNLPPSDEDSLRQPELYEDSIPHNDREYSSFFVDCTEDSSKEDQSFWHYYSDVLWHLDDDYHCH